MITVTCVSNNTYTAGSVVISEIMWGRDASLGAADAVKSQWIELHNHWHRRAYQR